jgi:quercetin dioxygenase-like cupin family protein
MSAATSRIVMPGEGKRVDLYDVRFRFLVESQDAGGTLAIVETEIPSGTLVKPHRHTREDEFSYVLAGVVGARLGEDEVALPAGAAVVKPAGQPHALWNAGPEPARVLEILAPGGFEHYFEEIAPILLEHGDEADQRFYELAQRYGIEIMDDWVAELETKYSVKL